LGISLISVYSITGRRIDIILSLNIQQECIHSLIVVEKKYYSFNIKVKMFSKIFNCLLIDGKYIFVITFYELINAINSMSTS
jgi:hypothetical protein